METAIAFFQKMRGMQDMCTIKDDKMGRLGFDPFL
uniref:Uncharacterized protein n=1 Tax=viral metagenome TaxID=1070528 RepID=A0A6C0D1D4_9ZZZZ